MKRPSSRVREFVLKTSSGPYVLLILILVAIFYVLTIRPGHDWGGDFAQYISHARNIAEGKPYADIGYIYCPYYSTKGPREYPPGFPILLAPVYRLFGLSFLAFKLEIIFLLLGSLAVSILLSKEYVPNIPKWIFISLFALNPWLVSFKDHVISDIPFLFFVCLFLVWTDRVYRSERFTVKNAFICAGLAFISYLVRGPGLVLVPTLLAYDIYYKRKVSGFGLAATFFAVGLILIGRLFFHSEASYVEQFLNWKPGVVLVNLRYYVHAFGLLWPPILGIKASKYLLFFISSVLVLAGLVKRRKISVGEVFLAGYVALILLFPFRQGLRYFLPVLPLYFLYLLAGAEFVTRLIRERAPRRLAVAILVLLACGSYASGLAGVLKNSKSVPDGPFTAEASEMLKYLQENTEEDSIVVFRKPRTLTLFSERAATTYPFSDDTDLALKHFREVGADYIAVDSRSESDNQYIIPLIGDSPSEFYEVFSNGRFTIYAFSDKARPGDS